MPDFESAIPAPPGFRIVRSGELDRNPPQTPGMTRAEAISHARVGAQKHWAGTVVVHPNAKTGPHHHGELQTVIYIVRGRARFRWGEHLEFEELIVVNLDIPSPEDQRDALGSDPFHSGAS